MTLDNRNVGHGYVFPRPDGMRARCGGPGICAECAKDYARKSLQTLATFTAPVTEPPPTTDLRQTIEAALAVAKGQHYHLPDADLCPACEAETELEHFAPTWLRALLDENTRLKRCLDASEGLRALTEARFNDELHECAWTDRFKVAEQRITELEAALQAEQQAHAATKLELTWMRKRLIELKAEVTNPRSLDD